MHENSLGCLNGGYPDPEKGCRECRCQDGLEGQKCEHLVENGEVNNSKIAI